MEKTAVKEMLDIVQMDFNNSVEISTGVILGMLKKALKKEKQQIIEAYACGVLNECSGTNVTSYKYYEKTFGNESET